MENQKTKSRVSEIIRGEIRERGPISFARFMELALYHPDAGYYERQIPQIGRHGDFYTSVSAGSLFGELLAFQFADWFASRQAPFQIVEAGAHNGQLAADILRWFQKHAPSQFANLEYRILEPSTQREQWQRQTLAAFSDKVRWWPDLQSMPTPIHGVMFGNELLDAFPVHRFGWDGTTWFEWGVDWAQDRFVWVRLNDEMPPDARPQPPRDIAPYLPAGYLTERSVAAEHWWRTAAEALKSGKLLTVDYGLTDEERWAPERAGGTLRAYRQHHVTDQLLDSPGEQDLTAHVHFSSLRAHGEEAGLHTELFCRQSEFLVGIAEKTWRPGAPFGDWTADRRRAFQTLIHPDHLGRAFRVLVQAREPA